MNLHLPVLRGVVIALLAAVVLVFCFVTVSPFVFALILLALLLSWAVLFNIEGAIRISDIPVVVLLLGTFAWGKGFSLVGVSVANMPLYITEIALAAALILHLIRKKSPLKLWQEWRLPLQKDLAIVLVAYFLMGFLYLVIGFAGNGPVALRDIVFCLYILFLFITLSLLGKAEKVKSLLSVMTLGIIFLFLTTFIIFFIYLPDSSFKSFVKEIKMTNLGLYCGLIVMFGLSFLAYVKKRLKWQLGLLIYLGFLFVIMAEVRAAWAGMLVSLILLGFLLKKELKIFILIFILVVGSFFIIDHFELGVQKNKLDSVAEQLKSMTRRDQASMPSANIRWRLDIWKQTLAEIKEYPVFGWGYGIQVDYDIWTKRLSWLKAIGASTGILPPHNHLLSITYKMGIVGLAFFLFINFKVFFLGLGYLKECKSEFHRRFLIAALAGLVYWHGMAFFFDVLESPPTGIFLWVLLGSILAVVHVDRTN